MITKNVINFLKALKNNNNKTWFEANRSWYESARNEFEQTIAQVLFLMIRFDKTLQWLEPRKCIFRIYRDVRFSSDKTPYKTNFGAWFGRDGKFGASAGYYLHVEPGEYFLSGGLYMPPPDILKAVRTEIFNFPEEFEKIIYHPSFKKTFGGLWEQDKLQRPPKGFPPDFPYIEWLKYKHYLVNKDLTEKEILSSSYPRQAATIFRKMHPLIVFLNHAIDENLYKTL